MSESGRPIVVIGLLFFVFGFVTWLGSVLIPYFKIACELSNLQSYLVAFAFYISYMVMALPSGWLLRRTGYKKGMSLGLAVMSAGALLFIPAAYQRLYPLFLSGLFVQGSGLALLQTASNPYITILGPIESAAKRISIMGICNGVAGMIAPLLLGAVVLKDADHITAQLPELSSIAANAMLDDLAKRAIVPYACMAVVLVSLALLVSYSGLPELADVPDEQPTGDHQPGKKSILQFPHLLVGVITLFLYVGVEVIAVDTIIGYASSQGMALTKAKFFTTLTLGFMLTGYVIGIISIPKWISQTTALRISAVAGLIISSLALSTTGIFSVCCIGLLGLANALVWPSIWPLAIDGLGKFTKTGSSLLIMAIGGGALLPLLYGWLTDSFGPHHAYWELIPCYLFILYYAVAGHKIGRTSHIQL